MTATEPEAVPTAPTGPGTAEPDDDHEYVPTSWEFRDVPPTTEQVQDKLKSLPDWFGGVRPEDYLEFVQPLPQDKNVAKKGEARRYVTVWTLYMSVAGRIAAINAAADDNAWRVDFEPDLHVSEGNPAGYVQFDDQRIVYRERCRITHRGVDTPPSVLGEKTGTAWVPAEGGSGAVQSNRFEKVETSARGRAIAAWGIGILPGSGGGVARRDA